MIKGWQFAGPGKGHDLGLCLRLNTRGSLRSIASRMGLRSCSSFSLAFEPSRASGSSSADTFPDSTFICRLSFLLLANIWLTGSVLSLE